jgi:hypothetical protein
MARPCGLVDGVDKYFHVLKNIFPRQYDLSKHIPFDMDGISLNILPHSCSHTHAHAHTHIHKFTK